MLDALGAPAPAAITVRPTLPEILRIEPANLKQQRAAFVAIVVARDDPASRSIRLAMGWCGANDVAAAELSRKLQCEREATTALAHDQRDQIAAFAAFVVEKTSSLRTRDHDGERASAAETKLRLRRQVAVRLAEQIVCQIGGPVRGGGADVVGVAYPGAVG